MAQQVLYACVPPLHSAFVVDMAAGLHFECNAGIHKAAEVVHVLLDWQCSEHQR